ncbi:MAG: GNAT family N-acetyltransferase [Candidatus Aminicenantales bacterium]
MDGAGWTPYGNSLADAWDGFVLDHAWGRFIHLSGFKRAVESVYGLKPEYWLHIRNNRIDAVFPSFHHRGLLSGKRLISQPFSEYGGILFAAGIGPGQRTETLDGWKAVIEALREKERFAHLEVRCFPDLQGSRSEFLQKVRLHEYGILPLHKELDLEKKVDYSVRKNVRRAQESGLSVQFENDEKTIRDIFYPLHLRSLKRLGSPPHPLAYFLRLRENLSGQLRILVARRGEVPVSALLGWTVGATVQITDIVSDERFFLLRANDLLHFEFIRWAAAEDFRWFDFGPVRYPGQKQYKKKWGLEFHEYSHYYFPARGRKKPLSDQNRWARSGSAIWRTLVPRCLAARMGKCLRRELAI